MHYPYIRESFTHKTHDATVQNQFPSHIISLIFPFNMKINQIKKWFMNLLINDWFSFVFIMNIWSLSQIDDTINLCDFMAFSFLRAYAICVNQIILHLPLIPFVVFPAPYRPATMTIVDCHCLVLDWVVRVGHAADLLVVWLTLLPWPQLN
jgi:hypothetical protein